MGLLRKAATFTVFEISGILPENLQSIIENVDVPKIEGTSTPEAFSFCSMSDPYEKGVIESGGVYGIGLRHDFKSISDSKAQAKKLYKEKLVEMRKEAKAERRKITREDKKNLKDSIEADFYMKAPVSQKSYDLLLDTRNKLLYVGSTTASVLDGFIMYALKVLPDTQFNIWNPLSEETQHNAEIKGSPDNFQNAFFTWIFYETKQNSEIFWSPVNIKFLNDDATISVKGDTAISLETFFAIHASRLVDSLDVGYKMDDERRIEVTLKRGTWGFKGLKVVPEMKHESEDSAVFERAGLFKEFLEMFEKLVKQFEEIRNSPEKNKDFWKSLKKLAEERIRREFVEA